MVSLALYISRFLSVRMHVFNCHYEMVIKNLKYHYNLVRSWDLQSSCKSPVGEAAPCLSELCRWTVVPLYEGRLTLLTLFVTNLPGYDCVSTFPEPFLWWNFSLVNTPTSQMPQQKQC